MNNSTTTLVRPLFSLWPEASRTEINLGDVVLGISEFAFLESQEFKSGAKTGAASDDQCFLSYIHGHYL